MVTLFLLTVFGLLLGAGIKNRMIKAGFDTSLPWSTSRRWWEVSGNCPDLVSTPTHVLHVFQAWIPGRSRDEFGLGNRLFSRANGGNAGEYENVPGSPVSGR